MKILSLLKKLEMKIKNLFLIKLKQLKLKLKFQQLNLLGDKIAVIA